MWIAATPDFDYKDVQSFKGQKIVTGMMPTTSTSLFLNLLKQKGMDGKTDVDAIPVPIGTEPGPFLAGQAKVAVMYEPGLDQVDRQGHEGGLRLPEGVRSLRLLVAHRARRCRPGEGTRRRQRAAGGPEIHPDQADVPGRRSRSRSRSSRSSSRAVVEAAVKRMIAEKPSIPTTS